MSPNQVRSAEDPQPTLMKETKVLIHTSFISTHICSCTLIPTHTGLLGTETRCEDINC